MEQNVIIKLEKEEYTLCEKLQKLFENVSYYPEVDFIKERNELVDKINKIHLKLMELGKRYTSELYNYLFK